MVVEGKYDPSWMFTYEGVLPYKPEINAAS